MGTKVLFEVIKDDGADLLFGLTASNGSSATRLEFYGYKEMVFEFSKRLMDFPKNLNDKASFIVGKDDPKWAYYLLIQAFCYDPAGHSAIEVIASSPHSSPFGFRDHFYIMAEAESINKWGISLKNWEVQQGTSVVWEQIEN